MSYEYSSLPIERFTQKLLRSLAKSHHHQVNDPVAVDPPALVKPSDVCRPG